MRYIRTDNEIYDIDDLYVCEELNGKPYGTKNGGWIIYKESIVKEADTIPELCDLIVCRNEIFYPLTSYREGNEFDWEEIDCFRKSIIMSEEEDNKIKETTNDFEPYYWEVYGAIWTDKGLIYVAKMNDKGELELL